MIKFGVQSLFEHPIDNKAWHAYKNFAQEKRIENSDHLASFSASHVNIAFRSSYFEGKKKY